MPHLSRAGNSYSCKQQILYVAAGINSGIQYNLPGCLNTVQPGAACGQSTPVSSTCCPVGFDCITPSDNGTSVCSVASGPPLYNFAPSTCLDHLHPEQECGKDSGMSDFRLQTRAPVTDLLQRKRSSNRTLSFAVMFWLRRAPGPLHPTGHAKSPDDVSEYLGVCSWYF